MLFIFIEYQILFYYQITLEEVAYKKIKNF